MAAVGGYAPPSVVFDAIEFANIQIANGMADAESLEQFTDDILRAVGASPSCTLQESLKVVKVLGACKIGPDNRRAVAKALNAKVIRAGAQPAAPQTASAADRSSVEDAGASPPVPVPEVRAPPPSVPGATCACNAGWPTDRSAVRARCVGPHASHVTAVAASTSSAGGHVLQGPEAWAAGIFLSTSGTGAQSSIAPAARPVEVQHFGRAARRRNRGSVSRRQELQDCDWWHRFMTSDMWRAFLDPNTLWQTCLELAVRRCEQLGLLHPSGAKMSDNHLSGPQVPSRTPQFAGCGCMISDPSHLSRRRSAFGSRSRSPELCQAQAARRRCSTTSWES
jgi:hypothetical protein